MPNVFDVGGFLGTSKTYTFVDSIAPSQQEFITPGTTSWTAPEGVTSVCAVAVGGGGGGGGSGGDAGSGGGGGGLGWKNNIAVVPGTSYTVVVGGAGALSTGTGGTGGQSYFIDTSTVVGNGGVGGTLVTTSANGGVGGTFVGDGGGNGGQGGNCSGTDAADTIREAGAGGGAGGYSGTGGRGAGAQTASNAGGAGAGGGGGGGGSIDTGSPGGGGGVGLLGQGANGAAGSGSLSRGGGGSGGTGGGSSVTGGAYGGGGGGADATTSGDGAQGAVRIIWGQNRAFPSTNTGNGQGSPIPITRYNGGVFSLNSVFASRSSLVYISGLNYVYYTQGTSTNPTTEAGLAALFNTATSSPTVTFGGSGVHSTDINWADVATTGAGGATGTKPAYLPANQFSWQVEGYILAPETGTYFFGCDGDDAMDVFVNNVNVANFYGGHGFAASWTAGVGQVSGSISLTAGQYYTFRARMQEGGGGDGFQVGWRKPSDGAIALIPSSAFYRIS